jgi:cytosine/adenosine deaminase-related metal-dependent hydrolase/2-polyprenyl-3-methyl-5-hydroxy-6-metoxy-1,4-benzoquinol methylase
VGAPIHQSAQAEGRKPVVGSCTKVSTPLSSSGVSPMDGYRLVSHVYDAEPNPILSLERRFLERLFPPIRDLDVVDLGCGTGRWLTKLAQKAPRSLLGVDFSAEMLLQAKRKLGSAASLVLADCRDIPLPRASADLILCSFVTSYLQDLDAFAAQARRLLRREGSIFLADLHPHTSATLGWRRGFHANGSFISIATHSRSLNQVLRSFETLGMHANAVLEPHFGDPERDLFKCAGKMDAFDAASGFPAIYILQLRLKSRRSLSTRRRALTRTLVKVSGARVALGPFESTQADVTIEDGRIGTLESNGGPSPGSATHDKRSIDLSGFLLLPGLVNAHDHLEFALFPRLGKGGYNNFVEWAGDIHHPECSPVREHRAVSKNTRLWWGGIRNLLCGVTTVCHHNPYVPELFDEGFAVRVLRDFSWAHSVPLDHDLVQKQKSAAADQPFIVHLAEGVDSQSAAEIFRLAEQNALDHRTVIVHGLGLNELGFHRMRSAGAGLVWCPTSNVFLFGRTHDRTILRSLPRLALGSDSPLTAAGDLLDEIRFATEVVGLPFEELYSLVTTRAADVLRLTSGEGTLRIGARSDFFAIRHTGESPAHRLASLNYRDVEFVVIGGQVQLASARLLTRLPRLVTTGLRPLEIEGELRWIRAPLNRLFDETRIHLPGEIKLGGRRVRHGRPA